MLSFKSTFLLIHNCICFLLLHNNLPWICGLKHYFCRSDIQELHNEILCCFVVQYASYSFCYSGILSLSLFFFVIRTPLSSRESITCGLARDKIVLATYTGKAKYPTSGNRHTFQIYSFKTFLQPFLNYQKRCWPDSLRSFNVNLELVAVIFMTAFRKFVREWNQARKIEPRCRQSPMTLAVIWMKPISSIGQYTTFLLFKWVWVVCHLERETSWLKYFHFLNELSWRHSRISVGGGSLLWWPAIQISIHSMVRRLMISWGESVGWRGLEIQQ